MVCEGHWKRDLAKSMFMVGKLVGSLVFGVISDMFGRRPVFLMCSLTGIITFNVLPVLPSFWLICVFQVINGTVTYGSFLTAFVFVMELIGGKYRTICGVMIQGFYTIGYLYVGLVAYFVRDWDKLQWIVSCPVLLLLPYYWIVPESLRWQIVHGRLDDAEKSCMKIAVTNKRKVNRLELRADLVAAGAEARNEQHANVTQIFRHPKLAFHSVIIFASWLAVAMTYYGLAYNADDLPGDVYTNFILLGVAEFPGFVLCIPLMEKLGHKRALWITMIAGGLACIASACVPEGNPIATVALALVGKALIAGAFAVVYNYSAEFFPTVVRQSACGLSSVCGRFGSIAAPQVHLLGKTVGFWIPMLIYGIVSFTAGILGLLLPESRHLSLPETIEEAAHRSAAQVFATYC